jgi:hypothetical protein
MEKLKLQEIINKEGYNITIHDSAKIHSFTMEREYFLDIFEIRYENSIDLNRPIKGLKETLDSFVDSSNKEIQSTSIQDTDIDIILYTDIHFNKIFGIVNFFK